jgi:hypothetical protein
MKYNIQATLYITLIGLILATVPMSQADEESDVSLSDISNSAERTNGKIDASDLDATASRFRTLVARADFLSSADSPVVIRQSTQIAEALLRSMDIRNNRSPVFSTIDAYLEKLVEAIDPSWKPLPVSANVMPPPGVNNAAAGMNPDAITDPELRRQYLDRIATNQGNNQRNIIQKELRRSRDRILRIASSLAVKDGEQGLQKADILIRFGKDQDCKAIIQDHFKRSSK